MIGFQVIKPGISSLLQDQGRFGHQSQGITTGGAMDEYAANWSNTLLGNPLNATLIEMTMGNLVLQANQLSQIAIAGANQNLKINGQMVQNWASHQVKSGDLLEFGWSVTGVRSYLAVRGGFDIRSEFDSTATVVRENIGGLSGSALKGGDYLPCLQKPADEMAPLHQVPDDLIPDYKQSIIIRVITGSQYSDFSPEDQSLFFNSEFRLTAQSDRMGIRLAGPALKPLLSGILSEGIPLGAIQVPPDGQPIIMMKDRQTLGGYPKLGSILPLDAFRLSQLGTGQKVRFSKIDLESAQNTMTQFAQFFHAKARAKMIIQK